MVSLLKSLPSFLYQNLEYGLQTQQVRHRFVDWRMLKDYQKRQTVKEYGEQRLRLNSLRKNKVLPPELQALADQEIHALPRRSCRSQVVNRCVVTSRPRSVVGQYHLSRIVFRHLADYNFLAGWERARW